MARLPESVGDALGGDDARGVATVAEDVSGPMNVRVLVAVGLCFAGIVAFLLGTYLLVGPVALVVGGALLLTAGAFGVDVEPRRARRVRRGS